MAADRPELEGDEAVLEVHYSLILAAMIGGSFFMGKEWI